jgi:hypothetical protein
VCSLDRKVESRDGGVGELDASVLPGAEPFVEVPDRQSGMPQDLSQMGLSQKRPNAGRGAGWKLVRMVGASPKAVKGSYEDSASLLAV